MLHSSVTRWQPTAFGRRVQTLVLLVGDVVSTFPITGIFVSTLVPPTIISSCSKSCRLLKKLDEILLCKKAKNKTVSQASLDQFRRNFLFLKYKISYHHSLIRHGLPAKKFPLLYFRLMVKKGPQLFLSPEKKIMCPFFLHALF